MSGKDLEAQQREGGEHLASGHIKIDDRRALERLRLHRLDDPSHWVLEVLRAATLCAPKKVTVTTSAREVVVRFDGKPFPAAVIDDLLHHALRSDAEDAEERARLLALGVAGALGAGAKSVQVTSGGRVAVLEPPEGFRVSARSMAGTEVRLQKRFSAGLGAFLRGAPEQRAVWQRCRHYPFPLELDGKPVNLDTPFVQEVMETRELRVGNGKLVVGLALEPLRESEVALNVLGVTVATHSVELPGLQVLALARGDDLQLDASGSDVVEEDAQLKAFMRALKGLWLELVERRVDALKDPESPFAEVWRERLTRLANGSDLEPAVKRLLQRAPLIGGPAGEWYSADDFAKSKSAAVHIATQRCEPGTYPVPTAYLPAFEAVPWLGLVPPGRRKDVEAIVAEKLAAARAREVWASQREEAVELPWGEWLARESFESPALSGEVGLEHGLNGAVVRLLSKGRPVQQGPVVALTPLRVHAVVNLNRELNEAEWAEVPSEALFRRCVAAVEQTALSAIAGALADRGHDSLLFAHGHDYLVRVSAKGTAVALPAPVREAMLFPLVGGGRTSLDALQARRRWLFVTGHYSEPLLSGDPVLALPLELAAALEKLFPGRLLGAGSRLQAEVDVRERLKGPRLAPRLRQASIAVPVQGPGLSGNLGLLLGSARQVELSLICRGILLERTTLTARFGAVEAAVACDSLTPNATWDKAVRDAEFERVVTALRDAERRLAHRLVEQFGTLDAGAPRSYALEYLSVAAQPDALDEAFLSRPMFSGAVGPVSFTDLRAQVARLKKLWWLPPASGLRAPTDMPLVRLELADARTVAGLLSVELEAAAPELERRAHRAEFLARPALEAVLPQQTPLVVQREVDGITVLAGLDDGVGPRACVKVRVQGRALVDVDFDSLLPLKAIVNLTAADPALGVALWGAQRGAVESAVAQAAQVVLAAALDALDGGGPSNPDARRAAYVAAGTPQGARLADPLGSRLRDRVTFACTDGVTRSMARLSGLEVLRYVTRAPSADEAPPPATPEPEAQDSGADTAPNRAPVKRRRARWRNGSVTVIAADELALAALRRWPDRQDVTQAMAEEARRRASLRATRPVDTVALRPGLLRRPLSQPGVEGEVGLAAPGEAGRVWLYSERRALAVVEGALPPHLTAAVNDDQLDPGQGAKAALGERWATLRSGILEDAALLADDAVALWERTPTGGRGALAAALAPLALWTAANSARGALLTVEVLERSDGGGLAVAALLAQKKAKQAVRFSELKVKPLDEARWVWRPRPGEKALCAPLLLTFVDASDELRKAEETRNRARVSEVAVPLESPWRRAIAAPGISGEVVLPERPSGELVVDVLHRRSLLERWRTKHPVGGLAMVDAETLTPNADWSKAQRNRAFTELAAVISRALAELLAQRLRESTHDGVWQSWAQAAVRWHRPSDDSPLAELVPSLPCFRDLSGVSITAGGVLAEAQRHRRVAIAAVDLPAQEGMVLVDTPETREMLAGLEVEFEEVSAELRNKARLTAIRRARRLEVLQWEGKALVRRPVKVGALSGELALPREPQPEGVVTLAKEFIGVCPWSDAAALGVVGVLDSPNLQVNEDWSQGSLNQQETQAARAELDGLWLALAAAVPGFKEPEREAARRQVLRVLTVLRVSSPADVLRLQGALGALAAAPVFRTVDGRWVELKTLALEAQKKKVPVFRRRLFAAKVGDALALDVAGAARRLVGPSVGLDLVLECEDLDDDWVGQLDQVLGRGALKKVKDLKEWKQDQAEADPEQGTPELLGLQRLRRELRLLRAGSLGHLKADELEQVLLVRGEGGRMIRYHAERRVVLLDGDDEAVRRALAEVQDRPDRLYALVAAIYGEVNRVLEHITDEHEAQLLLGLCAHLAANPSLLEAGAPGSRPRAARGRAREA